MHLAHPAFGYLNFVSRTETLHTPALSAEPVGELAGQGDVLCLIDAPIDFCPPNSQAAFVLYFDPVGRERRLGEGSYQITSTEVLDAQSLSEWASRASLMLQAPFLHNFLIGLDISDLRDLLSACRSQHLTLQIIELEAPDRLPMDQLKLMRFNHLFACLYGDESMTLEEYANLSTLLERTLPQAGLIRVATCLDANLGCRRILLLGEPRD